MGKRQPDFFPVVSMCWHTPLIHVVTLTKNLVTSQVTEMRALTKSLRSPCRRGGPQATYNLLWAPTINLASSVRNTSITKIARVMPITKSNKLGPSLEQEQITRTDTHTLLPTQVLSLASWMIEWSNEWNVKLKVDLNNRMSVWVFPGVKRVQNDPLEGYI